MTELWAGVAGALIAIVAILSTHLLDHFLKKDFERAQAIWKVRFEQCVELERDAGVLMKRLCYWESIGAQHDTFLESINRFEFTAGIVRRDLELTNAIASFAQWCRIVVAGKGMVDRPPKEQMEVFGELNAAYRNFLNELDRFVGVIGREQKA